MALDVKREFPAPFPFSPDVTPTACWEVLDVKRLGLKERCVICVLRSDEIHTFYFRHIQAIKHCAPKEIEVWFGARRVRIEGVLLTPLFLALIKGESCVLYEWREKWKAYTGDVGIKDITVDEG